MASSLECNMCVCVYRIGYCGTLFEIGTINSVHALPILPMGVLGTANH